MRDTIAKRIAFIGIMSALIFVILLLETLVFGPILKLNPAVLSIPLAITLCIYADWKYMFLGGTILGVSSLIIAFMIGNPIFIFPWISILPRVIMGICAYFIFKFIEKLLFAVKGDKKTIIVAAMTGVLTVLIHSGLVIFMTVITPQVSEVLKDTLKSVLVINLPAEMIAAAILVPIYLKTIHRIIKGQLH